MNKRIEQFAGQLGPVATVGDWGRVEWADNVYPQRGDKMYAAVDLAKFAELIVEECIKLNGKELAMAGHSRMVDVYCEHFGIEL
jgi:hypothetical protein